jgi:hypothetical protein
MSVFDLPRLHFCGTATTQLPTGPRQGLLDLATNRPLSPVDIPFGSALDGREHDGGMGRHYGANGHFAVDAMIGSIEARAGEVDADDAIVGTSVDFWGHYNEYLQTTVNRARVFDLDPSSNWTTTLMIGQWGFGRRGRSHDAGYALLGPVCGFQPPRWHRLGDDGVVVHQFVTAAEELRWSDHPSGSRAVESLRAALSGGADGLVVQFALLTLPQAPPGVPQPWGLRGTIAPWYEGELRTCPAGRLLLPAGWNRSAPVLSLGFGTRSVTFNLVAALESAVIVGDLELRGAVSQTTLARVPPQAWKDAERTGGVVWAPSEVTGGHDPDEAVELVTAGDGAVLWREREVNIQADDAVVILEHPRHGDDDECDVEVTFGCLVRGRPAAVDDIRVHQVPNPRALPSEPERDRVQIVRMKGGGDDPGDGWFGTIVTRTGVDGVGRFRLRGARAGSTRLHLSTGEVLMDGLDYDNDDLQGFWSGAGYLSVRVLPDDWWLDDVPETEVDFDLVYREVFAPYEALYSFMREDVFSLAEQCKVETYARLIWQMCDPRNRSRTYYMPPTRDLSLPKARLLLRYFRVQQRVSDVPCLHPGRPAGRRLETPGELVSALREAATLELAVMLQYLYAAYSVPTFGAGQEYVRRGVWTATQLQVACGSGGETLDGGIRGVLIRIAREEMIHFLLANNILAALGEPFHVPMPAFGCLTGHRMPIRFDLFRLSPTSLDRFVDLERPAAGVSDVRWGDHVGGGPAGDVPSSISELYGDIRRGLTEFPDALLAGLRPAGGEHHLFLREQLNLRHPDYQLEVDGLSSALFAIDVITEQGEGGPLADVGPGENAASEWSHHRAFSSLAATVRDAGWAPAYPVIDNPTVHRRPAERRYIPDPDARRVMRVFNEAYSVMLELMMQHFGTRADTSLRRSRLMNASIDVMTGIMKPLAEIIVTMPSGIRGVTAGPSFELDDPPVVVPRDDVAVRRLGNRLDSLAALVSSCPEVPARVGDLSRSLADTVRGQ